MAASTNTVLSALILVWMMGAGSEEIAVKHLVGLEYPPVAAQAQIQGRVVVECMLTAEGRVDSAQVRSGHPVLSRAARANAATWVFRIPAGLAPEARVFVLTYDFRLEGICQAPSCTSHFSFDSPAAVTVVTQARHWNPSSAPER